MKCGDYVCSEAAGISSPSGSRSFVDYSSAHNFLSSHFLTASRTPKFTCLQLSNFVQLDVAKAQPRKRSKPKPATPPTVPLVRVLVCVLRRLAAFNSSWVVLEIIRHLLASQRRYTSGLGVGLEGTRVVECVQISTGSGLGTDIGVL